MTRFHMFLKTPAGENPVALYEEQASYRPTAAAFSDRLVLRVNAGAPDDARQVYAVCGAFLHVINAEDGVTPLDQSVHFVLTPFPEPFAVLSTLAGQLSMMVPTRFLLGGIDPASVTTFLRERVEQAEVDPQIRTNPTSQEKWDLFMEGGLALPVEAGTLLGSAGDTLSVQVLTDNFHLDPVALFAALSADPNIELEGDQASWLQVVDRTRVLISVRNEWNEPLTGRTLRVTTPNGNTPRPLTAANLGTVVLGNSTSFSCEIQSHVLSRFAGASEARTRGPINFVVRLPAHVTIGSVNPEDWFQPQDPALEESKKLSRLTFGNKVEPLVDGLPMFARVVADLRAITGSEHFAYLANWYLDADFPLVPGDPSSTLEKIFAGIYAANANITPRIRAMSWNNWLYAWKSRLEAAFARIPNPVTGNPLAKADAIINQLRNGMAILDRRNHHRIPLQSELALEAAVPATFLWGTSLWTLITGYPPYISFLSRLYHLGAHHWKVTVINNSNGITAYLGGIDYHTDRLDNPDHQADNPYHDVHCRIEGPAVFDVGKAYIDRWNDHPENVAPNRQLPALSDPPPSAGTCMVQIGRTFAAATQSYAPNGDRTIWATLRNAVRKAKKYIYIEDQYLTYMELSEELLLALDKVDHLLIVVDGIDGPGEESPKVLDKLRYQFLKNLLRHRKAQEKLHVYLLKVRNKSAAEIDTLKTCKVHTKVVIVDDVFATIGSANMGRRSMTHDSEINAFVLDGAIDSGARKFARDFRIQLWAEHLGLHRQMDHARRRLGNIDQAFDVMLNSSPASSRLHPYALNHSYPAPTLIETNFFDPDGSEPEPA